VVERVGKRRKKLEKGLGLGLGLKFNAKKEKRESGTSSSVPF
jgi:hypothetical protein